MNQLLCVIIGCALLYASCSYTTISCSVEHNASKLIVYRKPIVYEKPQIMYQHTIQYCGMKQEIYSVQNETIDQLLAAEPERIVYSTMWGTYNTMEPIYVSHVMFVILGGLIMLAVHNEMKDKRYYK